MPHRAFFRHFFLFIAVCQLIVIFFIKWKKTWKKRYAHQVFTSLFFLRILPISSNFLSPNLTLCQRKKEKKGLTKNAVTTDLFFSPSPHRTHELNCLFPHFSLNSFSLSPRLTIGSFLIFFVSYSRPIEREGKKVRIKTEYHRTFSPSPLRITAVILVGSFCFFRLLLSAHFQTQEKGPADNKVCSDLLFFFGKRQRK